MVNFFVLFEVIISEKNIVYYWVIIDKVVIGVIVFWLFFIEVYVWVKYVKMRKVFGLLILIGLVWFLFISWYKLFICMYGKYVGIIIL